MNEVTTEQGVSGIVAEVADAQPEVAQPEVAPAQNESHRDDPRVNDLERRIRELEGAIGDLRTVSASANAANVVPTGRKTQASYAPHLLAKGVAPAGAGGVDAALGSLSLEQRFAVKAGLLRAGLI